MTIEETMSENYKKELNTKINTFMKALMKLHDFCKTYSPRQLNWRNFLSQFIKKANLKN